MTDAWLAFCATIFAAAFGLPDFVHRTWDRRAASEVTPADVVVFARYHDRPPSPYSYDDSNQPGDPAERSSS